MSFDAEAFVAFNAKMEWEGGLAEVVLYGIDETGDEELNGLLNDIEDALHAAQSRIQALHILHAAAIDAEYSKLEGDL